MRRPIDDVAVVGGGAAGLMAACVAAGRGLRTVVIERNSLPGRKLGITGKGRCNLTNNASVRELLESVTVNPRFLWSCVSAFSPADVMEFFESIGVPLKTERGRRVFPVSDKATDVVKALERESVKRGARWVNARATDVAADNGAVTGVETDKGFIEAKNVILCTGGLSYPVTGSTGDGYAIAQRLGHTIVPPRPSLVPLTAAGDVCARMQGFAPRNVALTVYDGAGRTVYTDFGDMLFTHFGVSGPVILSASARMRDFDKNKYRLSIDFKPALDEKKLDERILRDFAKFSNRTFANSLSELVARSMIDVVVELSGIDPEKKVNSVTREERRRLIGVLKAFPVEITGARPVEEAIVTSGGVATGEIDPKTMASKLVRGLYFAGEIIDVDACTGGYNLQIAWSTAHAAAGHIEKTEEQEI